MAGLGDWDFRPLLPRVKVPILVMEGAETFAPPAEAKEWVDGAPDARLFLVPRAGHEEFIEQPAAFLAAARRFLDGAWPE
jgi:pimeloyl-ACP methyl ester carboxylesterase